MTVVSGSSTDNYGFNFVHINLYRCAEATNDLINHIITLSAHFVLRQDPYSVYGLPPNWFSFLSSNGTAAIISTLPEHACVKSFESSNSIFVNLMTAKDLFIIGSVYSPLSVNFQDDVYPWTDFYSDFFRHVIGPYTHT